MDDLVSPLRQRLRDCEPERLRGPEVDDEFKPCRELLGLARL
jgi:hypothetical protein